jgi:hypothetical protein
MVARSRIITSRLALVAGAAAMLVPALAQAQGDNPDPAFQRVWARTDLPVQRAMVDRSWVWGPRPNATLTEPDVDSPGGMRQVQYYDKSRMEVNDPKADSNSQWYVTNGLLVVEMISGQLQLGSDSFETRTPAQVPVAGDISDAGHAPKYAVLANVASLLDNEHRAQPANGTPVTATLSEDGKVGVLPTAVGNLPRMQYFERITGHNVPDVFWSFMNTQGLVYENGSFHTRQVFDWVYTLGYPITEPYWINIKIKGKPTGVMMQAFQRRILTYNPENEPAWKVEMGNVGMQYFGWRYGTVAPPTPSPAPGGIVLQTRHFTFTGPFLTRQYSSIHDPLYTAVTTDQDWKQLWQRHTALVEANIPSPTVDFTREFVVAAFWGDKPDSCYTLNIGDVRLSGGNITVSVNTAVRDGPCLTVITQPHDFAAISRSALTGSSYTVDFVDNTGKLLQETTASFR